MIPYTTILKMDIPTDRYNLVDLLSRFPQSGLLKVFLFYLANEGAQGTRGGDTDFF